jgi:hypothetical protein
VTECRYPIRPRFSPMAPRRNPISGCPATWMAALGRRTILAKSCFDQCWALPPFEYACWAHRQVLAARRCADVPHPTTSDEKRKLRRFHLLRGLPACDGGCGIPPQWSRSGDLTQQESSRRAETGFQGKSVARSPFSEELTSSAPHSRAYTYVNVGTYPRPASASTTSPRKWVKGA